MWTAFSNEQLPKVKCNDDAKLEVVRILLDPNLNLFQNQI